MNRHWLLGKSHGGSVPELHTSKRKVRADLVIFSLILSTLSMGGCVTLVVLAGFPVIAILAGLSFATLVYSIYRIGYGKAASDFEVAIDQEVTHYRNLRNKP